MKVVHVLRKYNPHEWAGTETALQRLICGLKEHEITSVVYCPALHPPPTFDPLAEDGYSVKRYNACVPIWGIPSEQKSQMIKLGGNLMSFDLPFYILQEQNAGIIHSHTLGRIGAIGCTVAKYRKVPFVISIHGGVMDAPLQSKTYEKPEKAQGFEWGKAFGLLFKSRNLLGQADAVITYNQDETNYLQEKYPSTHIVTHVHGVNVHEFRKNHRKKIRILYPQLRNHDLILCVARIDPIKNQLWLVRQLPEILKRHPDSILFFVGPVTHVEYEKELRNEISKLGLENRIKFTGNLPPRDPALIGLLQEAKALILPSITEPFGLVVIEAWAAGTIVLSNKTAGPASIIDSGKNGWLFDVNHESEFHEMLDLSLKNQELRNRFLESSDHLIRTKYSTTAVASYMKQLYERLIEQKSSKGNSS